MDLMDGDRRGAAEQGSIYALTFDEFQNTLGGTGGGLGKDFGSMNMGELMQSIWNAEESQAMASASASAAGAAGDGGAALQWQGSLTLPCTLSDKTVHEVWRDFVQEVPPEAANGAMPQPNRHPTLGEMTLEEFLVRAGVVRDNLAAAAAAAAQPVAPRPIQAVNNGSSIFFGNFGGANDTGAGVMGFAPVGIGERVEGEAADGEGNEKKNARKPMELRSEMWQHFSKIEDDKGIIKKGKCKYCGRLIRADSYINGTTALKRHFNICKHNPHVNDKDPKQGTLAVTKGEGITNWRYDPEAIRQAFAEMVIEDELPFCYGEKRGFKKFMSVACPRWSTPSRRTTTRDTVRIYFEEKAKLKLFFKENCDRVCLTTDCWTSQQQDSYMTVTAHFIDNNWQFHRKVISFFKVKGHQGDDIGKNLHRCLLEWGIEKVMCVTVDNASANDSGVSYLRRHMNNAKTSIAEGKYLHMWCAAHIVNLIVQDGLKEVDTSVKRVRAAVRYIKGGTSRLVKFKELAEEEKVDTKAFLNLDICTRWNSTYLMLKAAISYEKVFVRYVDEDPCYAIDLSEVNKGPGHPDEDDWENAKKMAEFLSYFYELTERLSTNLQVNSHNFMFEIGEVHFLLNNWMSSTDPLRQEMGKRMKDKFDKYWGNWHDPPAPVVRPVNERVKGKGKEEEKENLNLLIFAAAVLDPRYKLSEYTKLAIEEIFSGQNGPKVWAAVKACVYDLFEEFRKLYAPTDTTAQTDDAQESKHTQGGRMKSLIAKKLKLHGAGNGSNKSELEKYLGEDTEPEDNKFDILAWWKANSSRFPILSQLARAILAIPVSTVSSEAVFSTTGRILDDFRTSLTPFMVQALVCTQDWLRRATPINVQEDMEQLAELEKELIEEYADGKGKRKADSSVSQSQVGSKSSKLTETPINTS